MKITAHFQGRFDNNIIMLRAVDLRDNPLIQKMFDSKIDREKRSGREIILECEIDAPFQHRSYKQSGSVWKLVTCIFMSQEHRKPTAEELYDTYCDLLEVYAEKTPSKITGKLRPIHLSEMNTVQCAAFIDGLLYHLTNYCNLASQYDLQADVRSVLYEWENWRGLQDDDLNDHRSIPELKQTTVYSEASGRTPVEYHHIVTRGANPAAIDKAWNILALTHDEHIQDLHSGNYESFIKKYPHLAGRIQKAQEKASKLDQSNNELGYKNPSLADDVQTIVDSLIK